MSKIGIDKKSTTKYEDRIVAFVDILGFSSMITRSESDIEEYEKIKHALDTIQMVKKELIMLLQKSPHFRIASLFPIQ